MNKRNFFKNFGIIAVIAIVGLSMMSCGEKGGTIIIENDSIYTWSVAIGSSSTRSESDSVNINPGEKHEKSFSSDGTYYAFGVFSDDGGITKYWKKKSVSLSGGETKTLKSGDF